VCYDNAAVHHSTVRSRLVLLVLACMVPMGLASVATVYYIYSDKQKQFESTLAETTRALALVVDQEIARREAVAHTMARSPLLTRGDLAGFYEFARSMAPTTETVVVLATPDGQQILNTRRPYGETGLPRLVLGPDELVSARRGTRVSSIYYAPIGKQYSFALSVPVEREGQARYLLSYAGYASALQKVFENQELPRGWVATIVDRDGTVVARNLEPDRYVGRKITERLRSRMADARNGQFRSRGIDDREILASFSTAPGYGWTVAVGVPQAEVGSPMEAALRFGGITALLLLAALWGAGLVSRSLLRPILAVKNAAEHIADAQPAPTQATGLVEMDTVLKVLEDGRQEVQRANARMQERVREALAEAEKAHQAVLQNQRLEALGQLTGGVAHDFNNLLMVVGNYAHLLRARHPGLAESKELAGVERAVSTGAKLTRQLLAFARRQPVRPEAVDLQSRLPDIAGLLKASLGSRIALSCEVQPDTRPVQVDPAEFELALINLAVNARDAMPDGGRLRIVAGNADERTVRIAVADDGSGIPAELLPRVFEPFVTTKPVGHGTGLGLSQVYGFAHQAGGDARIESEAGQGTTVSLLLPAHAAPVASAAEEELPASSALLAGRAILLVEDNEELATVTLQVLDAAGCRVTRSGSASAAQELLQGGAAFDAVLSDIRMPGGVDGIQLARWVREARPELPIVLMTGYSTELAQAQALGLQVLPKPCAAGLLIEALDRELRGAPSVAAP
jgi:signal transduction histidine kinase/ActR/RegA family two-component response regulator